MEQGYREEICRMGREPGAAIRRYELTDADFVLCKILDAT